MAQRLIDANKLVLRFEYGVQVDSMLFVPFRDMKKSVDKAPTVDAVPVVRCRNCKKSGLTEFGKRYCSEPMGAFYGCIPVQDDFFCSGGERRESNADR